MSRAAVLSALTLAGIATASSCPGCDEGVDVDLLSHLPTGTEQLAVLCARDRDNPVTEAFCGEEPPTIQSLEDVMTALDISLTGERRTGFGITANSTALSMRSVSAINPRVIFVQFPEQREDGAYVSVGYVRGEQLVEIGVQNADGDIHYYLGRYTQPCNERSPEGGGEKPHGGCTPADLLTPATESGWTSFSLYEDTDLENSVLDCLHCHQPEGPGSPKQFRMQELQNAWTHWFAPFTEASRTLLDDYRLAHGDEGYAGIPSSQMAASNPIIVQGLVERTNSEQVNLFPSPIIEAEVEASQPGQPVDNRNVGRSETWEGLFDVALRGDAIPPPFHDVKITDPVRLTEMASAYQAHQQGQGGALPDIRDVIRDEAERGMFIQAKPGLDAQGLVVQMCAQCHNDKLNPDISRANFNAFTPLSSLTDAEKDILADRLQRPAEDRYRMPPALIRDLTDEEIQRILTAIGR